MGYKVKENENANTFEEGKFVGWQVMSSVSSFSTSSFFP